VIKLSLQKTSFWFWIPFLFVFGALLLWSSLKKPTEDVHSTPSKVMSVYVKSFSSGVENKGIEAYGITEASKVVTLKAQTQGVVENILASDGAFLKMGAPILQISIENRMFDLARAQARIKQSVMDFNAAKALAQKSFQAAVQVSKMEADLRQAEADEHAIAIDIERTKIKAPFDGLFIKALLKPGEFVQPATPIGQFADLDPLYVTTFICEKEYHQINVGDQSEVWLSDGTQHPAEVSYKSPTSHNKTHTFEVRFTMNNPGHKIPAGLSAKAILPLKIDNVCSMPSAIITLNDEGDMGVKIVNASNQVEFVPVQILSHDVKGVLVVGVSPDMKVIVTGQDLVTQGQEVTPITQEVDSPAVPEEGQSNQ
jgi:multidrug efflux system membrane fusion protein